jgi:predicted metalloprotease with PDZ domain
MERVMGFFGLALEPEHPPKEGEVKPAWLGLNLTIKAGKTFIGTHMAGSPMRSILMPGDEIVAINGLRTSNAKTIETALKGKSGKEVSIAYAHEGVMQHCNVTLGEAPKHLVKLSGKGNKQWRSYLETRQAL